MSTTSFRAGDVVFVEFPYSDFQGRKRRPGLVLSVDEQDLLLARITTRPAVDNGDVALVDWSAAGLPRPSTVRLAKLATVDRRLVLRSVGRIGSNDGQTILRALENWLKDITIHFTR
jgi:mRNA interferase MazF